MSAESPFFDETVHPDMGRPGAVMPNHYRKPSPHGMMHGDICFMATSDVLVDPATGLTYIEAHAELSNEWSKVTPVAVTRLQVDEKGGGIDEFVIDMRHAPFGETSGVVFSNENDKSSVGSIAVERASIPMFFAVAGLVYRSTAGQESWGYEGAPSFMRGAEALARHVDVAIAGLTQATQRRRRTTKTTEKN